MRLGGSLETVLAKRIVCSSRPPRLGCDIHSAYPGSSLRTPRHYNGAIGGARRLRKCLPSLVKVHEILQRIRICYFGFAKNRISNSERMLATLSQLQTPGVGASVTRSKCHPLRVVELEDELVPGLADRKGEFNLLCS